MTYLEKKQGVLTFLEVNCHYCGNTGFLPNKNKEDYDSSVQKICSREENKWIDPKKFNFHMEKYNKKHPKNFNIENKVHFEDYAVHLVHRAILNGLVCKKCDLKREKYKQKEYEYEKHEHKITSLGFDLSEIGNTDHHCKKKHYENINEFMAYYLDMVVENEKLIIHTMYQFAHELIHDFNAFTHVFLMNVEVFDMMSGNKKIVLMENIKSCKQRGKTFITHSDEKINEKIAGIFGIESDTIIEKNKYI